MILWRPSQVGIGAQSRDLEHFRWRVTMTTTSFTPPLDFHTARWPSFQTSPGSSESTAMVHTRQRSRSDLEKHSYALNARHLNFDAIAGSRAAAVSKEM